MRIPELDPEGFEPQLLRYFTSFELATGAGNRGSRCPNRPEELDYLNSAIRAFEAVKHQDPAVGNLEGIQLWSTSIPNGTRMDIILRNPMVSVNVPIIPTSDRQALLSFFRENIRDIPDVTAAWFNIPYPLDNLSSMPEDEAKKLSWDVLEKLSKGKPLDGSDPQFEYGNLHGDLKREADTWLRYTNRLAQHSALEAIQFANSRIREAGNRFTGKDLEVARFLGYAQRAWIQDYLIEKGGFRNLPKGNKLKSLAGLSEAVDLMRADTLCGSLIFHRTEKIADRFADAGIKVLGRKVVQRATGRPFTWTDSTPQDPEIAFIQKGIISRMQAANL